MEINKFRGQLFGIATILVCLVHIEIGQQSQLMQGIHRLCQIGVDIFLLLSGIGCYNSLCRNNVKTFYINRIKRVMPIYLTILCAFGVFFIFNWGASISDYLYGYSFFSFPIYGIVRHWYIFAIFILYMLAPLFFKIVDKTIFWTIFVVIILVSSQLYFCSLPDNLYVVNELFICRVPIFMLGFYFGKHPTIKIDKKFYICMIFSFALLVVASIFNKINTMGIVHYLSIPAAVYFCCLLEKIFNRYSCDWLVVIGSCSLGMYLLQEKFNLILTVYFSPIKNWIINLISLSLSFIITISLEQIFEKIRKI